MAEEFVTLGIVLDHIQVLSGRFGALESRMGLLEKRIDGLENRVTSFERRVEERFDSVETHLEIHKGFRRNINRRVDTVERKHDRRIRKLEQLAGSSK